MEIGSAARNRSIFLAKVTTPWDLSLPVRSDGKSIIGNAGTLALYACANRTGFTIALTYVLPSGTANEWRSRPSWKTCSSPRSSRSPDPARARPGRTWRWSRSSGLRLICRHRDRPSLLRWPFGRVLTARSVTACEITARGLLGSAVGVYGESEKALVLKVVNGLGAGQTAVFDRRFCDYGLSEQVGATAPRRSCGPEPGSHSRSRNPCPTGHGSSL